MSQSRAHLTTRKLALFFDGTSNEDANVARWTSKSPAPGTPLSSTGDTTFRLSRRQTLLEFASKSPHPHLVQARIQRACGGIAQAWALLRVRLARHWK